MFSSPKTGKIKNKDNFRFLSKPLMKLIEKKIPKEEEQKVIEDFKNSIIEKFKNTGNIWYLCIFYLKFIVFFKEKII